MSWMLALKIFGVFSLAQIPVILYNKLVHNHKVKLFSAKDESNIEEYDLSNFYLILNDEKYSNSGILSSYSKYANNFYQNITLLTTTSYSIYISFFTMEKSFFYMGNILTFAILFSLGFIFMSMADSSTKEENDESSIVYIDKHNINYDKLFEINKKVLINCTSLEEALKKIFLRNNSFNFSGSIFFSYRYELVRKELLPILEDQEYYKKFFAELNSANEINLDLIAFLVEINDNIILYKRPFDQVYFKIIDLILEKLDSKELNTCSFDWYEGILGIINNKNAKLNENSKFNLLSEKVYKKFDFEVEEDRISFSQLYQAVYNLDSKTSYFWKKSFNFVIWKIQKMPEVLTSSQRKDFFNYIIFSSELFCSLVNNEKLIDYPFNLAIINAMNNNTWDEYQSCIERINNPKIITMLNQYFNDIEDLGFALSEHPLNSNFNMVEYFNSKLNEYWSNYSVLVRLDKNSNFKKQMDDKTKRDLKGRISEIERDHLLMEEAKRQSRIKQEELELAQRTYESQRRAEENARIQARNSEIAADNARQAANHAKREADTIQSEINSRKYGNPFRWDTRL